MEKAIIFNIQRYSLHDGGGIRTVIFLKGCPFTCPWCSNPESQAYKPEIMRKQSLCIKCNSDSCFTCGREPENCPTGALEVIGREYTIHELVDEVKKDIIFYETTGGGVTLSGGEPLSQGKFAIAFLKELKKSGIDTAIETTGMAPWEIIDELSDYVDTILWDFKIMDNEKSMQIMHGNAELMKTNFQKLMLKHKRVIPRIPLIPGYTLDTENINQIIAFLIQYPIREVHLLPFHQYGSSKYNALNKAYTLRELDPPTSEEVSCVQNLFGAHGITVIIGGA